MTRKMKPVEVELSPDVQRAVLGLPVAGEDGSLATVGELLERAAEAVERANAAVRGNALVKFTAAQIMRKEGRRGVPTIVVKLDGTALLRIIYSEPPSEDKPPPRVTKSRLPSLESLRQRAEVEGVNISDLGRRKLEIMRRLDPPVESPPQVAQPSSMGK